MTLLHTPAKDENSYLPNFTLKNVDGHRLNTKDISGKNGTAIFFICNHCPYVKAIITRLVTTARQLQDLGIGVAAIMPNDTEKHPDDSFDNMRIFANEHKFTFPYLIDETQEVAKSFDAICTPDLFGFDKQGQLQYRGRLDSSGPNQADDSTIPELSNAMAEIAQNTAPTAEQFSSMGCSIKWRD